MYVKNGCSPHSQLFIIGGNKIRSCEVTTQGDSVAIAVYAMAAYAISYSNDTNDC